ncbi:helix-turn-helix domain-containing protein [Parafilimonas sp.]|uniref:helix-turn-helix domain-containing protein n=1 Tax=Parafilimonas sp. TaxID=1969739 RepID=UPI0039E60EC1
MYLAKGTMQGYDSNKNYILRSGEYCVVRKNHLARYNKQSENGEFEKVVIIFDEQFLKSFQSKHRPDLTLQLPKGAFLRINKTALIPGFVHSLSPYYDISGKIDETFSNLKREELLLILLKVQPELADVFFDFGLPEKINLEAYMNRNYKFNVAIERFAYLTGRSLSAFKRDFKAIFNDTPNHWLVQKRLQEAYFLIGKKNQKPSDIYLDLGFENLSHFSFAFKKQFGLTPTDLLTGRKEACR